MINYIKYVRRLAPILTKFIPISILGNIKRNIASRQLKLVKNENNPNTFDTGVNIILPVGMGYSLKYNAQMNKNIISNAGYNVNVSTIGSSKSLPYSINLIQIDPYTVFEQMAVMDKSIYESRYNIYYQVTEVDVLSQSYSSVYDFFDEIWGPSSYSISAASKLTNKSVKVLPHAIDTPIDEDVDRAYFGLPQNKFLYLTMYDSASCIYRKNPEAVIESFMKAFPTEDDNVGLVIKVFNINKKELEFLNSKLSRYRNIYIINDMFEREVVYALISLCDVLINLPRAEGFGLIMAEAMNLSTAVITTGYSGILEYANPEVACLVDYDAIPIDKHFPWRQTGKERWAEPNVDDAARYMIKLYTDDEFRENMVKHAYKHISTNFSYDAIARIAKDYLEKIEEEIVMRNNNIKKGIKNE
jgi:glycosyltransferase involved in cell wall biosynthesis